MKNKIIHDVLLWFGVLCFVVAVLFFSESAINTLRLQAVNRAEGYTRVSEMLDENGKMLFRLIWVWVSLIPVYAAKLFK